MIELATEFTAGVQATIDAHGVPWSVTRLGARAEYRFTAPAPRDGDASAAAADDELDEYLHLVMANRGVLMTPFHNMALMCPDTTAADVDLHTRLFARGRRRAGAVSAAAGAEQARLAEADAGIVPWRAWGPYVAERAWGTVREDYRPTATRGAPSRTTTPARGRTAGTRTGWPPSATRSRRSCLGLALWNGVDPILKERMFGLTGPEGNHGEDAKEYWWYVDSTPTHSWMRGATTTRSASSRTSDLVAENARRGRDDPEYELRRHRRVRRATGTGCVDGRLRQGRPARPAACAIRVDEPRPRRGDACTCCPRCGSATPGRGGPGRPTSRRSSGGDARAGCSPSTRAGRATLAGGRRPRGAVLRQRDERAAALRVAGPLGVPEGRHQRPRRPRRRHGEPGAARAPRPRCTTCSRCRPGGVREIRLRLPATASRRRRDLGADVRRGDGGTRAGRGRRVLRRLSPRPAPARRGRGAAAGVAGLMWGKQFYHYDVERWLDGDPAGPPPPPSGSAGRNAGWRHLDNARRHLDARPVGVPLVRRLGPGLPLRGARPRRPRVRQGAAPAAAARVVHAPQRSAARRTSGRSAT